MKRIPTALLLLLLLVPSGVAAAPQSDAGRLFDDGRRLYEEGKYTEALAKFQNTLALKDSPNARLYFARTLHELGRAVEAYQEMLRTKDEAESLKDPKYVHTRDIAAARLAIIEKEIGRIIVVLSNPDEPIELTVGNRQIPSEQLGKIIAVSPGTVTLVATKPDGITVHKKVAVTAGELVTVSLDVAPLYPDEPSSSAPSSQGESAPPPALDPPAEDADDEGGVGALIPTGIVVATVGVAGMVMFAVAGSMALDKHGTISDECGDLPCPEVRYNEDIDDGQTLQLVANVGFGVGIGGLAVGAALIVIGTLTADPDSPSSDGVAVQAGPQGAFLGYSASF